MSMADSQGKSVENSLQYKGFSIPQKVLAYQGFSGLDGPRFGGARSCPARL